MTHVATVADLLARGDGDAPAIAAPERGALPYSALRAQLEAKVAALNAGGIGRNDRVAIVLPNGPEMATTFLAVAACATAAPLNPAYRAEEFRFYLEDLKAKALIVRDAEDTPAIGVARDLSIPVIPLSPRTDEPAGRFELTIEAGEPTAAGGLAQPDDIALVLHTSGTISRPKIVPLSQRNICASARHIAEWLELVPEDRCLSIMPLFHIHGLMAAVLASLHAGASVACTPGFNALRFFAWLDELKPT